ncbi:hypothetical protein BHM03_00045728 [Ensete ventricosum]|nr:hypothetical protein BHM03_00045728 [Ensete ventricosum]
MGFTKAHYGPNLGHLPNRGEEMTAAGGIEGGGMVATAVGEDFGCGCDCWSRGSVVWEMTGMADGVGLYAADGGDDSNRQRHKCTVAAGSRGGAIVRRCRRRSGRQQRVLRHGCTPAGWGCD